MHHGRQPQKHIEGFADPRPVGLVMDPTVSPGFCSQRSFGVGNNPGKNGHDGISEDAVGFDHRQQPVEPVQLRQEKTLIGQLVEDNFEVSGKGQGLRDDFFKSSHTTLHRALSCSTRLQSVAQTPPVCVGARRQPPRRAPTLRAGVSPFVWISRMSGVSLQERAVAGGWSHRMCAICEMVAWYFASAAVSRKSVR